MIIVFFPSLPLPPTLFLFSISFCLFLLFSLLVITPCNNKGKWQTIPKINNTVLTWFNIETNIWGCLISLFVIYEGFRVHTSIFKNTRLGVVSDNYNYYTSAYTYNHVWSWGTYIPLSRNFAPIILFVLITLNKPKNINFYLLKTLNTKFDILNIKIVVWWGNNGIMYIFTLYGLLFIIHV